MKPRKGGSDGYDIVHRSSNPHRPWQVVYRLRNGDWWVIANCKTEDGARKAIERQQQGDEA